MADQEATRLAQQLGRELATLRRDVDTLRRNFRAPQLTRSSIDNGYLDVIIDDDLRARIGQQSDGRAAVTYMNGDPPPTPTVPLVSARQLAVVVGWDGGFDGGVDAPSDLQRIDVHVSEVADFTPTAETAVVSLFGPGAVSFAGDIDPKYVRLVAVTTSQVASVPTDDVEVTPLPADFIAADAIGANELAAEIVLASRIISGDPLGARVEFSGTNGIEAFDAAGAQTVEVDTQGNARFLGEFRTDVDGKRRIMINPESSYLRLTGATDSRASTPDHASLDLTGDLDIRIKVSMDDWTPGSFQSFVGKASTAYVFWMDSTNQPQLTWFDGTATRIRTATTGTGFVDGTVHWLRVTLDVDNGAAGHTVTFYTSETGLSWTQLGTSVVTAGTTVIATNTSPLEVGRRGTAEQPLTGNVYYAEVRDGIDGTVVASPSFESQGPGAASLIDGTGKIWTVHPPAAIETDVGSGVPTSIRFYPMDADDTVWGQLAVGIDPGTGLPATVMYSATQRVDGGLAAWYAMQDLSQMAYLIPGATPELRTTATAYDDEYTVQAGYQQFRVDDRIPNIDGGARRAVFSKVQTDGTVENGSVLYYRPSSGGGGDAAAWTGVNKNSGVLFGGNRVFICDATTLIDKPLTCSSLTQSSGRESKRDIVDLEVDALMIVRQAPVYQWRYQHEDDTHVHVGPVAEDLPPEVIQYADEYPDRPLVDLGSMIGVLWDAVATLAARVEQLTTRSTPPS